MTRALDLHPDRLFSTSTDERNIARRLYQTVKSLPIISPHGHTDPSWFANNASFGNPTQLLIQPDHYVFRMLYSLGTPMEQLGIRTQDGTAVEQDPRKIWKLFASQYTAFRGTPSKLWLDYVFKEVFGLDVALDADSAEHYYEHIDNCLQSPEFYPRALFDRFNIECLATTESPLDDLKHHQTIRQSDWNGNVITAFRPDPVVDPDFEGFSDNLKTLASLSGEDTSTFAGYLKALAQRRQFFKSVGATSTDHGHPTAATADLPWLFLDTG